MNRDRDANPLLDIEGLPAFSRIRSEHVTTALEATLGKNRQRVQQLESLADDAHWDNFVQPLEDLEEDLARTWSPVSHLNAVKDSDELRAAYETCLPRLSAYHTDLGQNTRLFEGFSKVKGSTEFGSLDRAQCKIIDNALRDFHLMGVDLPESKKQRFKEIQQRLSTLSNLFDRNLLDSI